MINIKKLDEEANIKKLDEEADKRISKRVLLREPEVCMECNRVFLAIYNLLNCKDHEGLDEI